MDDGRKDKRKCRSFAESSGLAKLRGNLLAGMMECWNNGIMEEWNVGRLEKD